MSVATSEKTKQIVSELTGLLTKHPFSRNVELQSKTTLKPGDISYGLNYMHSRGLVKKEGLNRGSRWALTDGGAVQGEHKAEYTNGSHHVGLVKPVTVEISKSCLKLMIKHIVDRGEPLEGPLQQAVMKALLVLV